MMQKVVHFSSISHPASVPVTYISICHRFRTATAHTDAPISPGSNVITQTGTARCPPVSDILMLYWADRSDKVFILMHLETCLASLRKQLYLARVVWSVSPTKAPNTIVVLLRI
eukprot:2359062-Amphidinium_carterae.1